MERSDDPECAGSLCQRHRSSAHGRVSASRYPTAPPCWSRRVALIRRVVIDKEGYEMGHWLAERGFTVFVLFYRLPGEGWAAGPNVALSDAQRAMRLIRSRSGDYGVDPERVAAMGFSAGGHLCADLATRFAAHTYDPVDSADTLSARPLLAAPIYPVISMTAPIAHDMSRELLIGKDAGPELETGALTTKQCHRPIRRPVSCATPKTMPACWWKTR